MDKQYETVDTAAVEHGRSEGDEDNFVGEKQGTLRDVENMKRLGKDQVFKVGRSSCLPCSNLTL